MIITDFNELALEDLYALYHRAEIEYVIEDGKIVKATKPCTSR